MTDDEKRLAQQRAVSIAACAAVMAVGGPLVGYRVAFQKHTESYVAQAVDFRSRMVGVEQVSDDAGVEVEDEAVVELASATVNPWLRPVSYELHTASFATPDEISGAFTRGGRLNELASFTLRHLASVGNAREELDCLAKAVYYEARSESVAGQLAVAEVVMNRVRNPHYPRTICKVVYEGSYRSTGCQFTFTCDGSLAHRPAGESWDRAKSIALHVALGLNHPVTGSATHYHTDYVDPLWSEGLVRTTRIGTHIFYRFPKGAEWKLARARLAQARADRAWQAETIGPDVVDASLAADLGPPAADTISFTPDVTIAAPVVADANEGGVPL